MKISSFDKKNLMTLRAEIEKVLKVHGPEGVEFSLGNIRFSSNECKIELNAKVEGTKAVSDIYLETRIAALGLKQVNDKGWKLVSYKSQNWKMPFIYEHNGKMFKCSEDMAKYHFKA